MISVTTPDRTDPQVSSQNPKNNTKVELGAHHFREIYTKGKTVKNSAVKNIESKSNKKGQDTAKPTTSTPTIASLNTSLSQSDIAGVATGLAIMANAGGDKLQQAIGFLDNKPPAVVAKILSMMADQGKGDLAMAYLDHSLERDRGVDVMAILDAIGDSGKSDSKVDGYLKHLSAKGDDGERLVTIYRNHQSTPLIQEKVIAKEKPLEAVDPLETFKLIARLKTTFEKFEASGVPIGFNEETGKLTALLVDMLTNTGVLKDDAATAASYIVKGFENSTEIKQVFKYLTDAATNIINGVDNTSVWANLTDWVKSLTAGDVLSPETGAAVMAILGVANSAGLIPDSIAEEVGTALFAYNLLKAAKDVYVNVLAGNTVSAMGGIATIASVLIRTYGDKGNNMVTDMADVLAGIGLGVSIGGPVGAFVAIVYIGINLFLDNQQWFTIAEDVTANPYGIENADDIEYEIYDDKIKYTIPNGFARVPIERVVVEDSLGGNRFKMQLMPARVVDLLWLMMQNLFL